MISIEMTQAILNGQPYDDFPDTVANRKLWEDLKLEIATIRANGGIVDLPLELSVEGVD